MSDRAHEPGAGSAPLFQNQDEQERIYAPQQVPGAARPAADADDSGAETVAPIAGVAAAVPPGAVEGARPAPVVPLPGTRDDAPDEPTTRPE